MSGPLKPTIGQTKIRVPHSRELERPEDRMHDAVRVIHEEVVQPPEKGPRGISSSVSQRRTPPLKTQTESSETGRQEERLEENPVVPVRITLITHHSVLDSSDLHIKKPLILPQPLTAKPVLTPTGTCSLESGVRGLVVKPPSQSVELKEAHSIINRLRDQLRRVIEKSEAKDLEIIDLKQKLSELTLVIHRLKLENIKRMDEAKRSRIRSDNMKSRLEVCFKEIGVRDDEITELRREVAIMKARQAPMEATIARLQNAREVKARLSKEADRKEALAAVAENALKKAESVEARSHLMGVIERSRGSVARIEAQRRMWSEIERNHMMEVLGGMSLLSTSQYRTVRDVLPDYSPFASTRVSVLKVLLQRARDDRASMQVGPRRRKPWSPRFGVTYDQKILMLDKVDPPLGDEEKRRLVRHSESPEVEKRLLLAIRDEKERDRLSQAQLDVARLE
jgi:hypothetical protein